MPPLVSILIPAYNAEPWIARTLRSALGQTWPRKEVIVVDDDSSDGTVRVARQYESPAVHVLRQAHGGASAARNAALAVAQGDYIQWLDADDVLAPDKIARQLMRSDASTPLTLLSSSFGTFYVRPARAVFRANRLWQDLMPSDWLTIKFMDNAWMNPAVFLVSRPLTERAGGWDEALTLDDDGEYFARVVGASTRVEFVAEARMYYRIGNPGSLSMRASHEACRSLLTTHVRAIEILLRLEDSARARAACVRYLQTSFGMWCPDWPVLADEARRLARSLGGDLVPPEPHWAYSTTRAFFGSTVTRWCRRAVARIRLARARIRETAALGGV